jgi:hypothetical protein
MASKNKLNKCHLRRLDKLVEIGQVRIIGGS